MTPTSIGEKDATPNMFAPRGPRSLDALENVGMDSTSAHGPGHHSSARDGRVVRGSVEERFKA
jgi:hypothetical protein